MRLLFITLFVFTVLTGCAEDTIEKNTYPSAVMWNNTLFGLSKTEILPKDIDKELGKVQKITTPMPQKNGESNDAPIGSLILEIKGIDPNETIAVKVGGEYYQATALFLVNDN